MKKKRILPSFDSYEQESDFWDTHHPQDFVTSPKLQKVKVKGPKDKLITLRLDTDSRVKLERLADMQKLGPSTLARQILMMALENNDKVSTTQIISKLEEKFEKDPDPSENADKNLHASLVESARIKLRNAQVCALKGNWQLAFTLLKQTESEIPKEYFGEMQYAIQMIWSTIQSVSIVPLINSLEESVNVWDYDNACDSLEIIASICEKFELALNYSDIQVRLLRMAQSICKAAAVWRGDIDKKFDWPMMHKTVSLINKREMPEHIYPPENKELSIMISRKQDRDLKSSF